jgi:ABC-type uncharacterized transport system permease subunit
VYTNTTSLYYTRKYQLYIGSLIILLNDHLITGLFHVQKSDSQTEAHNLINSVIKLLLFITTFLSHLKSKLISITALWFPTATFLKKSAVKTNFSARMEDASIK